MKRFPMFAELVRNAETGASGVGLSPPAAGVAAPPPAAPLAGAPPAAPVEPAAGAAAADYWPQGLDQSFRGKDANGTLDNLAKAVAGYRERDAKADRVKTVDEMLDVKSIKDFTIDQRNQVHFDNLPKDPLFKPMAEVAIKHGVGRHALMDIFQTGLNAMNEAGLMEPMLDPVAERAALVPEAAKGLAQDQQDLAVTKRLQANYDFLGLAQQNMKLPADVAKYVELQLGDSAKGHVFMEWVRGLRGAQGNGSPGAYGGPSGGVTRDSLRAEMAALKSTDPDYQAKHADLMERYKAFLEKAGD